MKQPLEFHADLEPAVIIIFGIAGDLSTRKLLPSLYLLLKSNLLPEKTRILGIVKDEVSPHDLIAKVRRAVMSADRECDDAALNRLAAMIELRQMDLIPPDQYPGLRQKLDDIEDEVGSCLTRIFYLAIPPKIVVPVVRHLGEQGLNHGCTKHRAEARLLMEKPFGFDTKSAKQLIKTTTKYFQENQIFRIDHYLAKETVQNIVTFRFRNPVFEDDWDGRHIASIQIMAYEQLDIEGRANFYEQTGALRDLIQSHLLHVMAVAMMGKPKLADITDAGAIHQARQKLLDSIKPVKLADALRGQYEGYRQEAGNSVSHVETFAALKLFSKDKNWRNVPIYLSTGKALASKETKIVVTFKPTRDDHNHYNALTFHIQPQEGISLELWVKRPGYQHHLLTAPMRFSYEQTFDEHGHPDAYERVLVDAIRGDHTLFATSSEVMSAWRIIEPVIDAWSADGLGLHQYKKGTVGPDLQKL